jgi:Type IX secretion system protein PorV
MRTNKKIILLAVLSVMIFSSGGFAQIDKIAQTGMKWLSIPVGARGAALGNAYTAGTPDASSVFWNPAATALVPGAQIFVNQTQWIADINITAASVTYELVDIGVIGVHYMAADYGTFNRTQFSSSPDNLYETAGTFKPSDFAIGVSYARRVSDKFSFGANLRFLHEDLVGGLEGTFADPKSYDATLDAFAFDIGTLFYTGYKDLRIGMSAQNISAEQKYKYEAFPLPLTFKFGIAMDVAKAYFLDENSNQSVTVMVDAIHPRDFSERIHFGLEYGFDQMYFLRAGYKTNYDEENLSLGAGVAVDVSGFKVIVDYSYINFENFDPVQMFSFVFGF